MPTTWKETSEHNPYPKLSENLEVDVAIIGGGLTSIFSAYLLAKEGKRVAVLEKKTLGSDATIHTTAFITQYIDTDLSSLVDMFGEKGAKLVWDSHGKAIDTIEQIVKKEKINCEFSRCPEYIYASNEDHIKSFEEEINIAKSLGINLNLKKKNDLGFKNFGYIEIKNQAKFHPMKYLYGLAERAEKAGILIFENTEVVEVKGSKVISVKTKNGKLVKAKKVIIATYDPFNKPREVFAKKGMYVSYVLEVGLPKGILKEGLYLDDSNPYNYFRIDTEDKNDRLILGGADHRAELPVSKAKSFKALEDHLKTILPNVKYEIRRRWRGPILEPSDGLALIGEYKPNYYLAAAFSGNGMTYAHIAGLMFKDLLLGRKDEWQNLYNPRRPRKASRYFKKGLDYTKELFGGAVKNTIKYRA